MGRSPIVADGLGRAGRRPKKSWLDIAGDDRPWLSVMAVATAIEFLWWVVCRSVGRAPLPFLGTYALIVAAALAAVSVCRRLIARRRPQASVPVVVMGGALFAAGASLFLPLKFSIPKVIPFWLDLPLAHLERSAFGADPWRLLEGSLGWAIIPIDRVYGLWLPVQTVAALALMFEPPSPRKSRALAAFALGWLLLGVGAALILSSAGPLFFDRLFGGTQFAGLHDYLRVNGAWMTLSESGAMWRSFASDRPTLVAGISAAPSLHVAISFWIYLAARSLAPRFAPWAMAYAIFMWIASVALGWHYVADGLLGVAGMFLIWVATAPMARQPQKNRQLTLRH
jgi:hypothetical protein